MLYGGRLGLLGAYRSVLRTTARDGIAIIVIGIGLWQALPLECCPWQVDGEFFRIFSPELLEVAWECSIRVLQADPDPE
jgi:hypothetical protein